MKKWLSIILPLVLLFNFGGYYIWFSYRQYTIRKNIRHEIRKGLQDEDLTLFVVPLNEPDEINWIKPGKEFQHDGKMFDVVKTIVKDQKKYFYCLNDVKEKTLIVQWMKNRRQRKKAEKQVKRIISHNFIPQCTRQLKKISGIDITYPTICFCLQTGNSDTPYPPPKYA